MKGNGLTRFIKPIIVAFLVLSLPGGADTVANISQDMCSVPDGLPTVLASSELYMTNYFKTAHCAPRCVATADALGPLRAFCVDYAGCANMIFSGAYQCTVDPDYVDQFECTVSKK